MTKPQKQPPKPASQDFFSALCASELHVVCIREFRFHPSRKWRFDYAFPEHKLALEVEGGVWTGGRHVSPAGFLRDMEKYNAAAALGWRVLRTTPKELYSSSMLNLIQQAMCHGCQT